MTDTQSAQAPSPYVGHKFSSAADELVHEITLEGGCEHEIGDVQFGGWYGSIWFSPSDIPALEALGVDAGYAIAHEDPNGFWYVDYYSHHGEWEDAWSAIVAAEVAEDDDERPYPAWMEANAYGETP